MSLNSSKTPFLAHKGTWVRRNLGNLKGGHKFLQEFEWENEARGKMAVERGGLVEGGDEVKSEELVQQVWWW